MLRITNRNIAFRHFSLNATSIRGRNPAGLSCGSFGYSLKRFHKLSDAPFSSWKPNNPQDKPAGFSVKLVAFSEKCQHFPSNRLAVNSHGIQLPAFWQGEIGLLLFR